jgi:hypothetical protein
MAARIPRKFAQAWMAEGWRMANATEIMTVARAWKRQIAVMASAVRYVGSFDVEETECVGSVGEVARGK